MSATTVIDVEDEAKSDFQADQPLRGELLSIDHLRAHAIELAKSLKVDRRVPRDRSFHRSLEKKSQFLHAAQRIISRAIREGEPLTPEAEWLLDNFYVVEEHLRQIRDDLPTRYFDELPKLHDGTPRIYRLALDLIIHTDSVVQQDDLAAFIEDFQTVTVLSIGEMWAMPIMLRLALVENLYRLARQMLNNLEIRKRLKASLNEWRVGEPLPEVLLSPSPQPDVVANSFTVLGDLFSDDPQRFAALEQLLMDQFPLSTELIRAEHRRQAANQVSIGNVITSMRLISALDWMKFFEQTNLTERVLRQDPADIYSRMDPETRNRYRDAVEVLSKGSRETDLNVATRALQLARTARKADHGSSISNHIGYWLVDEGRQTLEQQLGFRPRLDALLSRWMLSHPSMTYFGSLILICVVGLFLCGVLANQAKMSIPSAMLLITAAAFPLSEFGVLFTNWLVTNSVPPRLLPKLDFEQGIPEEYRTFVIVPAMLTGPKEVASLLDRLELHYVSNADPHLRFALLTDFADSLQEGTEQDEALVDQAVAGIRKLNEAYGQEGGSPFYLFHRRRQWNEREGCWMGWERKRGKLIEFNRLLHGNTETSYSVIEGDPGCLGSAGQNPAFPFVITLDSDTQLPLGTARRLVGTLAHPLNRAELHPDGTHAMRGFTILQPRVAVQLAEGNKSRFTQLFANAKGIDPYATAASDVYQDLFGEGSFTGKGIYDVSAFETILDQAFQDNQILSHDLIEGCHVRVGLASDVEVIDGFPAQYDSDARRHHRWVRGDWQILPWLFSMVPWAGGYRPNRLSFLSRWKILDNLRRSLVAPMSCVLLIGSWCFTGRNASLWDITAWLPFVFPIVATFLSGLRGMPDAELIEGHLRAVGKDLGRTILQALVLIACLPHKAFLMADAIIRTLFRLSVTRRKMLEWETAAAAERRLAKRISSIMLKMAFVPLTTLILFFTIPRAAIPAAISWLAAWCLSPLIAYRISLPFRRQLSTLNDADQAWLRNLVKSSWSYFETCVGESTNWLPPDNLQEYPEEKLAERISPTNEGLYLVSLLVARDFGLVGLHSLLDLAEKNLSVWGRLPTLNGHFFNWYETGTLKPLAPRYVSTVDSGNLAASLLVFERGLDELCRSPIFGEAVWRGLDCTVEFAIEACERLQPRGARMISPPLDNLTDALKRSRETFQSLPTTWLERHAFLKGPLSDFQKELTELLAGFIEAQRHPTRDVEIAVHGLQSYLAGLAADFDQLASWVSGLDSVQKGGQLRLISKVHADAWASLQKKLDEAQSIHDLCELTGRVEVELSQLASAIADCGAEDSAIESQEALLARLRSGLQAAADAAQSIKSRSDSIRQTCNDMAMGMEFGFLYNPERHLFSIGYNIEDGKLDRSHYDMLCSEARLASHLAIAKGDVAYKHWFHLGRQSTIAAGRLGLLSWGGTMFEFLMPSLFQRQFFGSLLSQACETAVARQREYGIQCGVPWGVSESAFASMAVNTDYNYRSFGVPGLGLKRGLSEDLVVAPYATMLALSIAPAEAASNLRRLAAEGALGRHGFYDAIDYSPSRVPVGRKAMPVRCYMAHHHAMSILAIANALLGRIIERRFHDHPIIHATESLLQEAVPATTKVLMPNPDETVDVRVEAPEDVVVSRRLVGVETPSPRTHLLSNGTYSVMVTNSGGGYSQSKNIFVNRWRADGLNDQGGHFIYVRDRETNKVWSATYQPTCQPPDFYEVIYSIDKAEFRRRDGDIDCSLEIVVSPDNNVEHRQLKLFNRGSRPRKLDVTTFVEITLATHAADVAHPAFQKLFVETEYIPEETALIAKRRPRAEHEDEIWAFHVLASPDVINSDVQFESSRLQFLGRGMRPRSPNALKRTERLSGTTGAVLDPIFSLQCPVTIEPHASVSIAFTTGMAGSRQEALRLADQFHEQRSVLRAFELAWVFNQVQLHHMHLTAAKAQRFQQLASLILFPQPASRGSETAISKNRQGQRGLWRFGISGDRPILLVNVSEAEHAEFVHELLLAHLYWEHHGLTVDIVIMNTHPGSYLDLLQEMLQNIVAEAPHLPAETKSSIFLLRAAQFPVEDRWLLEASSRVVIEARRGWLTVLPQATKRPQRTGEAVNRPSSKTKPSLNGHVAERRTERSQSIGAGHLESTRAEVGETPLRDDRADGMDLEFWNGIGGFARNGIEYHIRLQAGKPAPAPWSNVIANPRFGCLVTEAGGGYTWSGNSRQNKLTNWSNDPVSDPPSEILYLQDQETHDVWLPMTYPRDGSETRWAQHGQGYSRFVCASQGLDQEILVSIAPDDPVKFITLKIKNRGTSRRRVSATYFADVVMGVSREETQLHLVSEPLPQSDGLLIRNTYHATNPEQLVFLRVIGPDSSVSGDRTTFLGRNGDLSSPNGLSQMSLSGTTGAALDPCGVVQSHFEIPESGTFEVAFILGCGENAAEAHELLKKYETIAAIQSASDATIALWDQILTSIQVETSNRAFDILVNRWLLYQVLSCRFWGRSAFYQSGGAFGFRDQLQDAMALVYSRPDLTRQQLLTAAARQYEEGDVQHWWHPPMGEGTRTRFSDDLLWLPYVTAHYINVTGDRAVLDESVPYLHSPQLAPGEQERYESPQVSPTHGTLYEHCMRTIEKGFKLGEHGLPLMGCGDWNDGMNQVGSQGRGESVWVAWFLLKLIEEFLPIISSRGDADLVAQYRSRTEKLRDSVETHGWDGQWYRRAFFDDGTPLGSKQNDECQIDSIVQSWAVIAHGDSERTDQALAAVSERLVSTEDRLVTLFTPPFDKTELDPGYIKGYLPGVRENGGQYTHAVLWLIHALTLKGDGDQAMKIFDYVNPILHTDSLQHVQQYRVEPYVLAADVYSIAPHTGRGGWTWYTGSAAWAYRVAIESILGFRMKANVLHLEPCPPSDWTRFSLIVRYGNSRWHIDVDLQEAPEPDRNQHAKSLLRTECIELHDDGKEHHQTFIPSPRSNHESSDQLQP